MPRLGVGLFCPRVSELVHAAIRERIFQFVREFLTKIQYVIYCAAFTAAQVGLPSGFY